MSKAGRKLLIKFVLQAILSYVMGVFLLKTLIDTIEKMMNAFWLGHGGAAKWGIQWMSWRNYPCTRTLVEWDLRISHLMHYVR